MPTETTGRTGMMRNPAAFFMALAFINWLAFACWHTLLHNYTIEEVGFGWFETGLLQTVREIPGFLAFTAIFWILVLREQTFAYLSLLVMAAGVAMTGFLPNLGGVLLTTMIMSVGFHYFEAAAQSLQLQILSKQEAPYVMGRIASAGAAAQLIGYAVMAGIWWTGVRSYELMYLGVGIVCVILVGFAWTGFARFEGPVVQNKSIVLRKRYWLYYAMQFMSGARRQIFIAFAGFLLVMQFGFTVANMALLMFTTALLTSILASQLGALVAKIGERNTFVLENCVLICVFVGYATTTSPLVAAGLYVIDGMFFTLYIAQRTYIQKIADAGDMAATSSVSFTINHTAAVVIPVCFGLLGMGNPSLIFWLGAGIATASLTLAVMVPRHPAPGNETIFSPVPRPQLAE